MAEKLHMWKIFGVLGLLLLASGCSTTDPAFAEGKQLLAEGKIDEGLGTLSKLAEKEPKKAEYRAYYFKQRETITGQLLVQAEVARDEGRFDEAAAIYRHALQLDADNQRAKAGLAQLDMDRRHVVAMNEAAGMFKAGNLDATQQKVRAILAENPNYEPARALQRKIEEKLVEQSMVNPAIRTKFKKPVTLDFREATLKAVFDILSRSADINFILDRDVRPDLRTTVTVRNSTLEEVVEMLLTTSRLEKKVLNDNTVLIYPATQEKKREYQDLVLKSFYLANADAKQVAAMLKTMVKTRDVFVEDKLNLVIMRDTPEAVRVAEQLVALQDMAEPEVMLEVEVMEVSTNRLLNLGIQYPDQFSYGIKGAAGPGTATLAELRGSTANLIHFATNNPALIVNLKEQDGSTNLLANPRIRVKNREKAKIHIGDRVPVITTTSGSSGFVSESVSYLDVGLKLDVEPMVYLENEVGIKVGLEVSNIVKEVTGAGTTSSSTLTYQIGTRNANTVLRLRDGETQILAGLISDEDRKSANKVPGLGDFPLLGRLFSSHNDTKNKTEIVLLITPHVVRNITRPAADKTEFYSGSEAAVGKVQRYNREAVPAQGDRSGMPPGNGQNVVSPAAVPVQ